MEVFTQPQAFFAKRGDSRNVHRHSKERVVKTRSTEVARYEMAKRERRRHSRVAEKADERAFRAEECMELLAYETKEANVRKAERRREALQLTHTKIAQRRAVDEGRAARAAERIQKLQLESEKRKEESFAVQQGRQLRRERSELLKHKLEHSLTSPRAHRITPSSLLEVTADVEREWDRTEHVAGPILFRQQQQAVTEARSEAFAARMAEQEALAAARLQAVHDEKMEQMADAGQVRLHRKSTENPPHQRSLRTCAPALSPMLSAACGFLF